MATSAAVLIVMGVAMAIHDPSRLDRHWTAGGYLTAFAVVVGVHLIAVPLTLRKLRNDTVKRRHLRWLGIAAVLLAVATATVLVVPPTTMLALALGTATQATYWKAMYELAGASPDDWDRGGVAQKA